MSYARFGADGSDVYVYASARGYIDCCMCSLAMAKDEPDPEFRTFAGAIAHLEEHVVAGQVVPASTFDRLRDPAEQAEVLADWARRGGR